MKKFVILAVLLVLVTLIAAYFLTHRAVPIEGRDLASGSTAREVPQGAQVIMLTKDGFSPSEITIKKGETVAFRTENGKLFWPASNLHPSHLLYPEFDPKQPIEPEATWSFTFEKPGTWQFHDHLAPYFTGTITVTE